jgi:hypothetical protein
MDLLFVVILTIAAQVVLTLLVLRDARRLKCEGTLRVVAPHLWAWATLLLGILPATAYWLINHTALDEFFGRAPSDREATRRI